MLFIHPMWEHENQRIGKQKRRPVGYALHGIAELIGFAGLLSLLIVPLDLGYKAITGTFHASLLWGLAVPFCFGIISEVLYQYSWMLALRKSFKYDYELCEASWIEAGERRTYKWQA